MGEASPKSAFLDYARVVKDEVDAALARYFEDFASQRPAPALVAELDPVLDALRALVMRGGKRLRGVFLAAAYEACGGAERSAILPALVSFELLQAYLLVHDDWIDQDETRRGGPTVHAALRSTFGERDAATFAVLAGDLAHALALESLCACTVPEARIARAAREMGRLLRTVTIGQMLDVRGSVQRQSSDAMRAGIDTIYEMKTASYTVAGPLIIGAVLGGASETRVAGLAKCARPLGVMFQLRDDLLGVFGDPAVTGKSASSDLLHGKFTALVVEAADDPRVLQDLTRLQQAHAGNADAAETGALVESLRARITASGARARLEQRIEHLHEEALVAISAADITANAKDLLVGAATVLGGRDR